MSEKILIPLSILIAGLLVGVGLYMTKDPKIIEKQPLAEKLSPKQEKISIVDPKKDHIIGNFEKAKIFVVEYADLECPGCKLYHQKTLLPLIEKYKNKEVAFVFRHFPFDKSYNGEEPLHPTAGTEAQASECAALQGGDDIFFKYIGDVFEETNSDGKFPLHRLPVIAEKYKLDKNKFIKCLKDKKTEKTVEDSYQEALRAGLESTPSVFIQIKNTNQSFPIVIEYNIIDKVLSEFLSK